MFSGLPLGALVEGEGDVGCFGRGGRGPRSRSAPGRGLAAPRATGTRPACMGPVDLCTLGAMAAGSKRRLLGAACGLRVRGIWG